MPELILEHRLDNGLTVLGDPMPGRHVVAFCLALPAGYATEEPAAAGLSSVEIGMLLRGTRRRDARALSDALDNLGLHRGESVESEFVEFHGAVPRDSFADTLALYREIVREPAFPEDQLAAELEQGLQAIAALEDDPERKLMHCLRREFVRSAHGASSLGTSEGIRSLRREALVADHARRMRPRGAILAVAGGFEWACVIDATERLLGDWQGEAPVPEPVRLRAEPWQTRIVQDTAQEHIGIALPGIALGDPDFYPLRLAVSVLSGGMSGRLFTEVRERRGLAYAVGATFALLPRAGIITCYAGTTPERADETLEVLGRELDRLADGVTAAELDRARTGVLSTLVMEQESSMARASAMASDQWLLGRVRPLDEIQSAYRAVHPDEVGAVLARRRAVPRTSVRLGPDPNVPRAAAPGKGRRA